MGLKKKTILIVVVTLSLTLIVLHATLSRILMGGFAKVEETTADTNLQRARDALSEKISSLTVKASDWAAWDDTYHFIQNRNRAYIESNLLYGSIKTLQIEMILFFDISGRFVHGAVLNPATETIVTPDDQLVRTFIENPSLLQHRDQSSATSGLLQVGDSLLMAASLPIVNSERNKPVNGTLVFGKRVDAELVRQLSLLTHLDVELSNSPASERSDISRAREQLSKERPILQEPLDSQTVGSYALLVDILGRPCAVLSVLTDRDIYHQGLLTYRSIYFALCLVALVFSVTVLTLLQQSVLSRLLRLNGEVRGIRYSATPIGRVTVQSSDELSELAEEINSMLQGLEQTQLKLKEKEEIARQASQAKSSFVANISHELRTPLNGIIGMATLLLDTPLKSTQRDYGQTIYDSANYLLEIINEVLDFSRIEAGKYTIAAAPFDLANMLDKVHRLMEVVAAKKGLSLSLQLADEVPRHVVADEGRVRQLLVNLIGNAIKFTETGSVQISVERLQLINGTANLKFTVADTGIGIPAEHLDSIFGEFSQVDDSPARNHGGTGLGLTITKRIIQLMGGEIGVTSQVSLGSTFWFSLHLPVLTPSGVHQFVSIREETTEIPPSRILLVEDNLVNQKVALGMLKKLGIEPDVAKNGQDALKLASANSYQLILMDCHMPVMDGYAATKAIRSGQGEQSTPVTVPIIALTANALDGQRDKCLEVGMNDFLSKPFQLSELRSMLSAWLTKGEEERPSSP